MDEAVQNFGYESLVDVGLGFEQGVHFPVPLLADHVFCHSLEDFALVEGPLQVLGLGFVDLEVDEEVCATVFS